jgi:UDPglucose 6-dehydrogenase
MRLAPSLTLIERLIAAGASVRAYDLVAMENARRVPPESWFKSGKLALVKQQYDAAEGVDALVLVTEWKSFRHPDFDVLKRLMRSPVIFDGRNQYGPQHLGFEIFRYRTLTGLSHRLNNRPQFFADMPPCVLGEDQPARI